ncbi:MAG TPA: ABC transporter permease [Trebonia sp.]|jgi:peptide/nickel transport system permease protein|nr:ABC transporter permease [Trebonia sp.]HEX4093673.1 ABC transporter permease [Trebonia sp.]
MIRFVLRRLGAAAVLLLVLTAIVFGLQKLTPGDGVHAYVGANASPQAIAAARRYLGLDSPLPEQYVRYLWHALHGNFGTSLRTHDSVAGDLGTFFPATAELVLWSFLVALILAVLFAVSGALRVPGGFLYRGVLLLGATAPPFLLGLGGLVLFYAYLGWLPASGRGDDTGPTHLLLLDGLLNGSASQFTGALEHLVLPALALAIAPGLAIGRILRSSLDATLATEHVRTARAKGLAPFWVIARHVIRNSLGPALSMAGLQLGFMFAGVVVVEQIFNWPGIGNYLAESIPVADFPAIAGVTLLLGSIYIVVNAVVDVLQALADPRITL